MMGAGGLGVSRQGAVQAAQCFFISAKPDQRAAEIAQCARVPGIDRQGTADQGCAFFKAPGLSRNDAREMQRVKIAWVAFHYCPKTGLSRGKLTLLEKGNGLGELLLNGAGRWLHLRHRARVLGKWTMV